MTLTQDDIGRLTIPRELLPRGQSRHGGSRIIEFAQAFAFRGCPDNRTLVLDCSVCESMKLNVFRDCKFKDCNPLGCKLVLLVANVNAHHSVIALCNPCLALLPPQDRPKPSDLSSKERAEEPFCGVLLLNPSNGVSEPTPSALFPALNALSRRLTERPHDCPFSDESFPTHRLENVCQQTSGDTCGYHSMNFVSTMVQAKINGRIPLVRDTFDGFERCTSDVSLNKGSEQDVLQLRDDLANLALLCAHPEASMTLQMDAPEVHSMVHNRKKEADGRETICLPRMIWNLMDPELRRETTVPRSFHNKTNDVKFTKGYGVCPEVFAMATSKILSELGSNQKYRGMMRSTVEQVGVASVGLSSEKVGKVAANASAKVAATEGLSVCGNTPSVERPKLEWSLCLTCIPNCTDPQHVTHLKCESYPGDKVHVTGKMSNGYHVLSNHHSQTSARKLRSFKPFRNHRNKVRTCHKNKLDVKPLEMLCASAVNLKAPDKEAEKRRAIANDQAFLENTHRECGQL